MYSDRQRELNVFLCKLQQRAEEETGERTMVRSVTKTDGKKILEIVIGENFLLAPVVYVEEDGVNYGKNRLENILQGFWTVYNRYKELERRNFAFDKIKENLYLRLVSCDRNHGFSESLIYRYFLDLAEVPVLVLEEDMEDRCFSLTVNIQKGMCDVGEDEVFQTASENGEKDSMLDGLESSAEELGYEIFTMNNGHHLAVIDKEKLKDLAEETHSRFLYIVPVSIYEVLVISEDNVFDIYELEEFSKNRRESLDFEETMLSEKIYRYSVERNDIDLLDSDFN